MSVDENVISGWLVRGIGGVVNMLTKFVDDGATIPPHDRSALVSSCTQIVTLLRKLDEREQRPISERLWMKLPHWMRGYGE